MHREEWHMSILPGCVPDLCILDYVVYKMPLVGLHTVTCLLSHTHLPMGDFSCRLCCCASHLKRHQFGVWLHCFAIFLAG